MFSARDFLKNPPLPWKFMLSRAYIFTPTKLATKNNRALCPLTQVFFYILGVQFTYSIGNLKTR